MTWTDERVEKLTQLWAAGDSAREIACALSDQFHTITRCAVLGKAHRLGLDERRQAYPPVNVRKFVPRDQKKINANLERERKAEEQRARRCEELSPEATGSASVSISEVSVSKPCQLMDLNENTCRWPIGDPGEPDFHFCGAQPLIGRPYCRQHYKIAHQKPAPKAGRHFVQNGWKAA